MRFQLDDVQSMICDSVAAFTRDRVREQAMAWNEDGGSVADELEALGELGLLGVLVPERLGGADMGACELVVALEQLAIGDAGLAAAVAAHNVGALGWLLQSSSADPQVIRELAQGRKLGCSGHVTGPTIGALYAHWLILPGRTIATVDLTADDVSREPFAMLGLRTAGAARITFSGEPTGAADPAARTHVDGLMRLATASIAVGLAARALQEGVQYSLERVQFGKPIARYQALQWMTADSATELSCARLMTARAAWLHDEGKPFADAAARACLLAVRYARAITDRALQMHGGYGYTEDFVVERLYRDAHALHALTGRTDIARIEVARRLAATVA